MWLGIYRFNIKSLISSIKTTNIFIKYEITFFFSANNNMTKTELCLMILVLPLTPFAKQKFFWKISDILFFTPTYKIFLGRI